MPEKTQKSIEKPWAVYGLITRFIGRVVHEFRDGVDIMYSEGQLFATQPWSSYAVERFATSGEAIDYVLSVNHEYSRKRLTEKLLDDFPKAIRKESIQRIHDILSNCVQQQSISQTSFNPFEQNPFKKDGDPPHPFKRYSQSQPKCTKKLEKLEKTADFGYPDDFDCV